MPTEQQPAINTHNRSCGEVKPGSTGTAKNLHLFMSYRQRHRPENAAAQKLTRGEDGGSLPPSGWVTPPKPDVSCQLHACVLFSTVTGTGRSHLHNQITPEQGLSTDESTAPLQRRSQKRLFFLKALSLRSPHWRLAASNSRAHCTGFKPDESLTYKSSLSVTSWTFI